INSKDESARSVIPPSINVAAACPLPPSPPLPRREHLLPVPEKFSGDLDKSRGFLMQCALTFRQQPQAYATDCSKITLMVELLTGRALQWRVSLFLFKAPGTPLVLGFPWLRQHNPQIDWAQGRVTGWSEWCHE
uniref:DUF4939 domain-containing protein n=1 Tax=Haplochromis burtoni TaxID=8153 RepID=A0A3Q3CVK3_HAPBU